MVNAVKDSVETFFHSCKPMEIAKQESGNCRMLLLGLIQVVSNLILLVAFFVAAGKNGDATLQEKHASWLLVTLLAWLLPTLVIVGGLLDGLFVLHLVEGKATKGNKLMKGKQKKKPQRCKSFFNFWGTSCFYSSTESEPKLWCFLPVMDCHDLLLWSNFFVDSRHLVPTLVEFEKLTNVKAENDFDTYIHIYRYITTE